MGSVSAGGGCAVRGGELERRCLRERAHRVARLASEEVSAGPRGPGMVPPGTGGGGESPALHRSAA